VNVRLRADRGLDVAEAYVGGRQIAWMSGVGDVPWNGDWRASWGGGLVTTCGLDNVGVPSEGVGQHGTYTSLPAESITEQGGVVEAVVHDPRGLRVERTIAIRGDSFRLLDRTTNVTDAPLEAPLLYHVNLGDWAETVETAAETVVPRDEDAEGHDPTRTPPRADEPERVWEHVGGLRHAVVRGNGLQVEIASNLPRMWQWIDPFLGSLAIEPANCSVLGRAHDRAEGRLPFLLPGELRESWLTITAKETT
jgi:hypothetical protein